MGCHSNAFLKSIRRRITVLMMSTILLISVFSVSSLAFPKQVVPPVYASPGTFGYTTIGTITDTVSENTTQYIKYELTESAVAQSVSVYVEDNVSVKVGIYGPVTAGNASLKTSGGPVSGSGWVTVSVAEVELTAGWYYLAFKVNATTKGRYDNGSITRYFNTTEGYTNAWTNTINDNATKNWDYSIYCTFETAFENFIEAFNKMVQALAQTYGQTLTVLVSKGLEAFNAAEMKEIERRLRLLEDNVTNTMETFNATLESIISDYVVSMASMPKNGYSAIYRIFYDALRPAPMLSLYSEIFVNAIFTMLGIFYQRGLELVTIPLDSDPPTIATNVLDSPQGAGPYTVTANITDEQSGVYQAKLCYSINNGTSWTSISMTKTDSAYSAGIPDQANGTVVWYYIQAEDRAHNTATDPQNAPDNHYIFAVEKE